MSDDSLEVTEVLTTLKPDVTAQDPCKRAVVAGYGVVGKTVSDALTDNGVEVTVVDSEAKDGVDVVNWNLVTNS